MRGEDYCGGYGGGASCAEVAAGMVFDANVDVVGSTIRFSLSLTLDTYRCEAIWAKTPAADTPSLSTIMSPQQKPMASS